jgi:hypothetical protein
MDLLKQVSEFLVKYGYRDTPPDSWDEATTAIQKFQASDINVSRYKDTIGPPLVEDGIMGPATLYAMSLPRCGQVHTAAATDLAIGSNRWKGCHGGSDIHKAVVRVDESNLPGFLRPVFVEVLRRVRNAYAKMGLLFVFMGPSGDYLGNETPSGANIKFSFTRGDGWIGLAIVGNPGIQRCDSTIWCRYEYRYQPSNIAREWTTLINHELGHNCGLGHSRGGKMNPSLVAGLPPDWTTDDPSHGSLSSWFSGVPIDLGETPEPPPDGDDPPNIGQPLSDSFKLHDGVRARLFRVFG